MLNTKGKREKNNGKKAGGASVFSSRRTASDAGRGEQPVLQKRFRFVFLLFILASLGVLFRYGSLMLKAGGTEAVIPARAFAERGAILDRNGRILAMQTRVANISVWRPEISNLEGLSRDLAPILELSPEEIQRRISSSPSDFIYLKRQVDQSTIQKIEAEIKNAFRGVNIEPIVGRIYPEGRLASQIIGFVGSEGIGLEGIEYAFESDLAPNSERNGNQVILTLDSNVQYILEEIAEQALVENKAEAAMLLAMDPRTGDILGSASLPGFDPNNLQTSTETSRMNRPAIWSYEPGSVFKIFSLAALIDAGAVTGNSTFLCDGHYERITNLGERITINCLGAHGRVGVREIILYSCNAGAAYAADRLRADSFYEAVRSFGFGSRVGSGNPGETIGVFRPVDRWSDRSKPTIAMGQEVSVSTLQMLQAATAVANDGVLVPPRIVSLVRSGDGKTERPYTTAAPRRIIKSETAQAMREYMKNVTSVAGTGWRANVADLSLAVKTGTAQITDPDTGVYSSSNFIASAMALLPAEEPSLILYVVIVKPQGESYYGGRIAAPYIRQAAESLVDYLGIPRGRNPQVNHSGTVEISRDKPFVIGATMPNFSGLSKRQLLPFLLNDEPRIELRGDGWVKRQTPPPGTPLKPETVIILELEPAR
ncbi:MAG: transpeptidase family protein [Spirochaetaceae bacterium]|jgi:cell division protein FtsI (penicillin-binding protein 3)|nr:transpeptidase family protein [Spirochaetaceae bacterium]